MYTEAYNEMIAVFNQHRIPLSAWSPPGLSDVLYHAGKLDQLIANGIPPSDYANNLANSADYDDLKDLRFSRIPNEIKAEMARINKRTENATGKLKADRPEDPDNATTISKWQAADETLFAAMNYVQEFADSLLAATQTR